MFDAPHPRVLAAILLLTAGCGSTHTPSSRADFFVSTPLSAAELEIEYSAGGLPAHQRSFHALCRSAAAALDRGFRYLRIHDRERLAPGEARWKLRLYPVPPEGAVILDIAAPAWEGDPPLDGVLDAASFAAACGR